MARRVIETTAPIVVQKDETGCEVLTDLLELAEQEREGEERDTKLYLPFKALKDLESLVLR